MMKKFLVAGLPAGPTGELRGEVDISKVECLGKPS
jgi:hypothetical protein